MCVLYILPLRAFTSSEAVEAAPAAAAEAPAAALAPESAAAESTQTETVAAETAAECDGGAAEVVREASAPDAQAPPMCAGDSLEEKVEFLLAQNAALQHLCRYVCLLRWSYSLDQRLGLWSVCVLSVCLVCA